MHALGESFRDTVGERLDHDRAIVVIGAGVARGDLFFFRAGGDDEGADIIRLAALLGRDEIGEREIGLAVALLQLLAQRVQRRDPLIARLAIVERDVVADGIRRPEADDGLGREPALLDNPLQHGTGVIVQRRAASPRSGSSSSDG